MKLLTLILLLAVAGSASAQTTNRPAAKAKTKAVVRAAPVSPALYPAYVALAASSNRIALLEKKMKAQTAKDQSADVLTKARRAANKISGRDAFNEMNGRAAVTRAMAAPMKQEIAEIRLRDLELRRRYKMPDR